jgi:hypothetical protein
MKAIDKCLKLKLYSLGMLARLPVRERRKEAVTYYQLFLVSP